MVMMLIWGLFSSCISEDHSDCYNRYWLDLSYTGDGTEEIFKEKIDKVSLFVFDENSSCVFTKSLSQNEIQQQSTLLPALKEGKYTIVCLANDYETSLEGLSAGNWENVLFSGHDPNYLAVTEYIIEPYFKKKQEEWKTAVFACSHYDISVNVEGAPASEKLPKIILSGIAPSTDFTNSVCGAPVDYQINLTRVGDLLSSSCNIFRHQNHQDVCLKVVAEDGSELACVNFGEYIAEHNIDCSRQETHIPFKIVFKSANVEVTFPGWDTDDVIPDFN